MKITETIKTKRNLYMCKHNIENEYINELNKYAKEKNKGTTQEVISSYLDENHPENSKMVICDVLSFIAAEEKYLKFVLSCTCFFIGIGGLNWLLDIFDWEGIWLALVLILLIVALIITHTIKEYEYIKRNLLYIENNK